MATYKKRGYKPKKEKVVQEVEETFDETQSTTAEVFNTLDETANKSEEWIEKNSKPLFYGLVVIAALILGYLGYNKFIGEPTEREASNELAHPRALFDEAATAAGAQADSLYNLALIGGVDGKYGFTDISSQFGGTKAGNLANYYAGISYLKMKKYKEAIDYLSKFDSDDALLGPVALGAIGDAFADINQLKDALDYYQQAANKKDNQFTTPLFLFKAGQVAMELKDYSTAEKLFTTIKEKYANTDQGRDIEKHLNSAKYAQ
ncbi:tetratricopeptide repeat protein [uncultured Tenacibaculum sp.]|uniref:tetratricopeptide repeat protein n=1 Tax=uncultured Tenacibaculum sp. TaxID=174713 RepID=UPI00262111BD|nr:tetratricopeptide repeat protein [uncultured Tenacibaculum sp.]